MHFERISVLEARDLIARLENAERPKKAKIVDVRDERSFAAEHIKDASHLDNASLQDFIDNSEFDLPVLVYCYHGHMSMNVASYLASLGFTNVYSLDGGFEAWKAFKT